MVLGISRIGGGNLGSVWNRGQSQQPQLVLPTHSSSVQYDHDAALDQLTATNTSLNSNEEGASTVEYLISQEMQWVLNVCIDCHMLLSQQ